MCVAESVAGAGLGTPRERNWIDRAPRAVVVTLRGAGKHVVAEVVEWPAAVRELDHPVRTRELAQLELHNHRRKQAATAGSRCRKDRAFAGALGIAAGHGSCRLR